MNKPLIPYTVGLLLLFMLLNLLGCTNDDVRVMLPGGLLVTATPEVTATPNPRLVGVPTEWTNGVKHFPLMSVDTDGLTIPQTRQKILTTIQGIYPENATNGCYGDMAAYHQKVMHSFANLFAHPSSDGVPFGEIAANVDPSVYSSLAGYVTPKLITFTENFVVTSIPNQHICASHHYSNPSLYIFDRQQNVYRTNVYGRLYRIQSVDNGLLLTLDPSNNSGDTLSISYAHIITDTKPMQAYSLGNYRLYWSRFFETDYEPLTISPDYQTIILHHVLGTRGEEAELPCEVRQDPELQIAQMLVKTDFVRQGDQYVEGETQVVEVNVKENDEQNNSPQSKIFDEWQNYCLSTQEPRSNLWIFAVLIVLGIIALYSKLVSL